MDNSWTGFLSWKYEKANLTELNPSRSRIASQMNLLCTSPFKLHAGMMSLWASSARHKAVIDLSPTLGPIETAKRSHCLRLWRLSRSSTRATCTVPQTLLETSITLLESMWSEFCWECLSMAMDSEWEDTSRSDMEANHCNPGRRRRAMLQLEVCVLESLYTVPSCLLTPLSNTYFYHRNLQAPSSTPGSLIAKLGKFHAVTRWV